MADFARYLPLSQRPDVDESAVSNDWRALTADLLPAAGFIPGSERVYAAVTHSGITIAPAMGELVAAEVITGNEEPLLAPFRPGRFATAEAH